MKYLLLKTLLVGFAGAVTSGDVSAQNKTKAEKIIIIKNGDTTVLQGTIKKVDKAERDRLKRESNNVDDRFRAEVYVEQTGLEGDRMARSFRVDPADTTVIRKFDKRIPIIRRRLRDSLMLSFGSDSLADRLIERRDLISILPPGDNSIRIPNAYRDPRFSGRPFVLGKALPNSQVYSYNNTDKDGFTTRMNIAIAEPSAGELKAVTGYEKAEHKLAVEDLTVFPNFSSGKMTLSFSLGGDKSTILVKITDTGGKELLSDRVPNFSGTYLKQFNMPRNGSYYILINQNGRSFVKKVVKE